MFAVGFGNLRDYGTVGGIDVGELARATHKTAVNVILQEFHGDHLRFSRDLLRQLRRC